MMHSSERTVRICYNEPAGRIVNRAEYDAKKQAALNGICKESIIVNKKTAEAWIVKKNELCRISVIEGSQVGDVNFWNLHNPNEKFYSGKTRQLHAAHLTTYDRLWSNLPYLNPLATIVGDTLQYGVDEDGASVHDVIGTRCDNYSNEMITGEKCPTSCHQQLTKAIEKFGLNENDVHDVWNIFMCTGFTKDTHRYFVKGSPAKAGDYIEFIADMDLLVAVSACPEGDVAKILHEGIPDSKCFPLKVEVFSAVQVD